MSELRKWEDFELDCLMNIRRRVGTQSLVLYVPFVCKSWFKASLDPSCWRHLHIPARDVTGVEFYRRFRAQYRLKYFSKSGFVRLIVSRGLGKSTSVVLGRGFYGLDPQRFTEKCLKLESLSLMLGYLDFPYSVPKLVGNLKLLEELTFDFGISRNFTEIMAQIGHNCKNFHTLSLRGLLEKECVLAIANHLPKIKNLSLMSCFLEQEHLEIILHSCKELAFFYVNSCKITRGIWQEEKIKKLASHIRVFNLDASRKE